MTNSDNELKCPECNKSHCYHCGCDKCMTHSDKTTPIAYDPLSSDEDSDLVIVSLEQLKGLQKKTTFIDEIIEALSNQREEILRRITPALDDFSDAANLMIQDGILKKTGQEIHENIGYIKSCLSSLTQDSSNKKENE